MELGRGSIATWRPGCRVPKDKPEANRRPEMENVERGEAPSCRDR